MSVVAFRIGLAGAASMVDQVFGSTLAPGRWHSLRPGPNVRRISYAAGNRALAQLEKRVHANGVTPVGQALFKLELPDDVAVGFAEDIGLPTGWRGSEGVSQAFGDHWIDAAAALALWVPSYVEPLEHNLVINVSHPRLAEVKLVKERDPFEFDPQLM